MGMNYRSVCNAFALGQIKKDPDIPDFHLMVGSAEYLSSLPVLASGNYVPKQDYKLMTSYANMEAEDVTKAINEGALEVDDFIENTYFTGAALGEV